MKKTIQNHFEQYQLSDKQVERLQEIQSRITSPRYLFSLRLSRVSLAIAASVVFMVIGVLTWWQPWQHAVSVSSLATEIAYHHNKQMVMEVESSSLDKIRTYLAKLDFPLIESKRFSSSDWELVGGRYCSLKGHLAAQLRIQNKKTFKTVTFYQLLLPHDITDFDGTFEDFEQGVKVDLWKERGLLLGTARDN